MQTWLQIIIGVIVLLVSFVIAIVIIYLLFLKKKIKNINNEEKEILFNLNFDIDNRKKFLGDKTLIEKYYDIELIDVSNTNDVISEYNSNSFKLFKFNLSRSNSTRVSSKNYVINENKQKAKLLIEGKKIIIIGSTHNRKINYADIYNIGYSNSKNNHIIGIYLITKGGSSKEHKNLFIKINDLNDFNEIYNTLTYANAKRKRELNEEYIQGK